MKGKVRGALAKMARHLNRMTTAIVPTGAESKDPLDPFVQMRKTGNDRTEIVVGTRTLFAGSLDVTREVVGADGTAGQEVSTVRVVAERRKRGGAKGLEELETFHPVKSDLTLDKSVELYKRPEGRWGVRGGRALAASPAWLSENGFASLDEAPFETGFRQIGSRECCVAEVMLEGKSTELSAPVVVERVRGPTVADDHYRLVTADLGRGDEVELIEGAAKSDPLVTEVIRRVAAKKWQAGPWRQIAETAGINALKAGATVDAAMTVSGDLSLRAGKGMGATAASTYAAAGAAAGAAHRGGMPVDGARVVARKVVTMAEYLRAHPTVPANAAAHPDAQAHQSAVEDGRASADDWPCKVVVAAHTMASGNLGAVRNSVATQDRGALGPDLSAINAAARELFIEKKVPRDRLAAAAGEAARKRIALARKTADGLSAEAAKTRDELDRLEIRIAQLEVDLERNAPEPPDSRPEFGRGGGGRHSAVAEKPRLAQREYQVIQRKLRYELGQRDTMAVRLAEQTTLARAAEDEVTRVSGDRTPQRAAAVKALLAADAAAPGRQHAALAAGKAASWAMRAAGDEVRAERVAAAAHLAALAGANEDDAEVAGRLMAQYHDAAGGELDDAGLLAARAAIVQVVTGGAGTDPNRQILAAAATTAALDGAKPNIAAAAGMGKAIGAAEATPSAQPNRVTPVFSVVDSDAPSGGGAKPSVIPAIPMHYEAIESRFDPNKAVAVAEWKHAKIREVTDLGLGGAPGHSTTSYIIEVVGPKGRYWADFDWSPNANQLYGEISIKPSGTPDDQVAAQAKTTIAYSGVTADWGSFEQRAKDLKVRTDAAFAEVARLLTSRDADLTLTHLQYHGEESGHLANLLPHTKMRMEEEIRLFVQGRHSQPRFKDNISKMFIELADQVEDDRSRKKAIIRHQIDSVIRVVTSLVLAGGLGGARVAAAFLGD